jgi:hypothetical protein
MMDAGKTAIRMNETQPSKPNGSKGRTSATQLAKKMIRPLSFIFVGITIVSIGLGAWSYLGSRRQADEGDSISELEGLDFPAPAFDTSRDVKQSSSVSGRKIPASGAASERAIPVRTKDQSSVNGQDRFAAVWLTGTIEEVDRNEPADSIRRISGGRSESTNLR